MRDFTGVAPSSLPPTSAPDFQPRLRNMLLDIDYFLRDLSRGVRRISDGEIPDGSGKSLSTVIDLADYLFKPGVFGGQVAHGGTEASDTLTLRGTNNTTGGTVIAQGMATQAADIFQIQNSAGTVLASITSGGNVSGGPLTTDSLSIVANNFDTSAARMTLTNTQDFVWDVESGSVNPLTLSLGLVSGSLDGLSLTTRLQSTGGNSSSLLINNDGGSAATVPFIIERHATQSADLTRWRDDDGVTILSRIDKDGTFIGPIASTSAASFLDSLFTILDDGDNTKTLKFSLGGASAGADLTLAWAGTADRTVTIPDGTTTLAGLSVTETFLAPQTITPTAGTALTLNAPSGTVPSLVSTYTDTAFPGAGTGTPYDEVKNGIWTLSPTLSNAGGIGLNAIGLSVAPDISDLLGAGSGTFAAGVHVHVKAGLGAADDGSMVVYGLRFVAETQGASGSTFNSVLGEFGGVQHASTDAVTTATGIQGTVATIAGAGAITTANVFATTGAIATAVTSWRGTRINNPSGAGAIGTAIGISIASITRGSTNYAIDSAGGQSRHVGNFFFGAATDPTARIDIAAGTTAVAPIRLRSGTSLSSIIAGTIEFTTDDLFFSITAGTRHRLLMAEPTGGLTSGRVPFATTNGRLTDDSTFTFASSTLTVSKVSVPQVTLTALTGAPLIVGDDPPAVASGFLGRENLTAQVADIAATNLSNTPPVAMYEVEVYLMTTTADVTAGTLAVVVGWTDSVGATTETVIAAHTLAATGRSKGRAIVRVASGNITYAVTATGAYGTSQYAISVRTIFKG